MFIHVPLTQYQNPGSIAANQEPPYQLVTAPIPLDIARLEVWKFSRIVLELPLALFTGAMIKYSEKNAVQIHFKTEAERGEAAEGKGGIDGQTKITVPATISTPQKVTEINRPTSQVGTVLEIKEETTIEESIFPLNVTVLVQILDQSGIIWSDSFPITFIYRPGTTQWLGKARISNYTDLINPFKIRQGQNCKMQIKLVYAVPVENNFGLEENAFANLYYETEIEAA